MGAVLMNCVSHSPMHDEPTLPGRRYLACHDPFWPRIELQALRQRLQLPGHISDTQLELAAWEGVDIAAREFATWRRCLRERGYRRLADVSGHAHGRALSICYLRLVEAATRRALVRHAMPAINSRQCEVPYA